jgi:hypothetical protein
MRETRQSGSEGGEGDLPDPYTRGEGAAWGSHTGTCSAGARRP